jgi:hypothetical protein
MVFDFKLIENKTKRSIEINEELFNTIVKNNKLNYYQTCKSHGANRSDLSVWVDVGYIDIEKFESRVILQRGVTHENNVLYRVVSQHPGTMPIINPNGLIDITVQLEDEEIQTPDETLITKNTEITNEEPTKLGGKYKKKSKKKKLNKIKVIFKSKKKI